MTTLPPGNLNSGIAHPAGSQDKMREETRSERAKSDRPIDVPHDRSRASPRAHPTSPQDHPRASSHDHPRASSHDHPRASSHDHPIDADYVIYRLEEAGATLLALPGTGWSTRMRSSSLEIVRTALEAYGWETARVRPAVPPAEKIDRMDEAMAWISLIPVERYVLRRVVGARSLVHPITDRHLFTWRRLGTAMGADHKAVQRWHAQGIGMIVERLPRLG